MEINSGDLTIRNSEIFAESNNYMAIDGDRVEITNSSVTAVSNRSSSYALFGSKGVSIINSSVVANSPRGDGIRSGYDGDLVITGSTVTASSEEYSGLAGYRGCTITDSVVEATGKYQGVCFSGAFTIEGDSKVTISNLKPGYAAVLTGSLNIGEGLAVRTPENAVIGDYQGNMQAYKTFLESDGQTRADTVVIQRIYNVNVNDAENGEVTADRETAFEGDTVTLTISPDAGYTLASLTVETGSGETVEVTGNTFAMPADDVVVTASFTVPVDPDREAADAVIAKINAIGTVKYTSACKKKIDAARSAYDALTDAQKALVDNYETLTAAEARYAALKKAAADQKKADAVIAKINAIGTVEYTDACKAKIDEARTAYDALTKAQKRLVTNYKTLTDAEARYEELKAAAENPAGPDEPAGDNVCKWCGKVHTGFWQKIVGVFHTILYFFAHLFGTR